MARPPRIQIPDVVYHVGSRGVEKRAIFGVLDHDRAVFLDLLYATVRRHGWRCYAYCLMGNHFHLAVETPRANIGDGMKYLKGRYAVWFNQQAQREGALFERRYFGEIAKTEAHAYELMRYIVLNPVRARLCAHPADWQWSSFAGMTGRVKPPPFLNLSCLHDLFGEGRRGLTLYEQFVEDGLALSVRDPSALA